MLTPVGPPGPTPAVGVTQIGSQGLYPKRNQSKYCEVCRGYGLPPRLWPILQKYSSVPNNNYYEFCASITHHTDQCMALDALVDRLDCSTFRVNETPRG